MRRSHFLGWVFLAVAAMGVIVPEALAQIRGGQGGGRGFGDPWVFDLLKRESFEQELKITAEQKEKLAELGKEFDKERQDLGASFFRPGAGGQPDPSAFEKQMEDFRKKSDELRAKAEGRLKDVFSEEQVSRYRQLALRETGITALSRSDVSESLKLTDEQKAELKKVQDDYRTKSMQLGFRATQEERDKARTDRDAALLAVLSDDQKASWEKQLGPAPAEAENKDVAKTETPPSTGAPRNTPPSRGPSGRSRPGGGNRPEAGDKKPEAGEDVVAEFAPEALDKSEARKPGSMDEKTLSFQFRFAPWEMVLKRFAKEAGLSLDMDETPPGTFNYYDDGKFSPTEALDILNGYLLPKGFVLVRRDRFLVVANIEKDIPPNLIPTVSVSDLSKRGRNELLSVMLPVAPNMEAKTAADEIKELLGPQGKVIPLGKINKLLVTDTGSNLQRVYELLTGLGAVDDPTGKNYRAFKLMYVSATDAERTIRELFDIPARGAATRSATTTPTTGTRSYFGDRGFGDRGFGDRGFGDRGFGDRGFGDRSRDERDRGGERDRSDRDSSRWGFNPQVAGGMQQQAAAPTSKIQLAADVRTNSLLVTATGQELALIEQAIKTIDVRETAGPGAFARGVNVPQLEVYPIETADPKVVMDMINATVPGLTMIEDTKTKRLNVYATPADQAQVRAIVKQLDGIPGNTVTVVQLKKTDAVAAATSLSKLFGNSSRSGDGPHIEADALNRRLMIRGTPDQMAEIRKLLADMGEDGNTGLPGMPSDRGNIRTISPGGRPPEEIISLVERIWPSRSESFIRVVPSSAVATPQFRIRDVDEQPNEDRPSGSSRRRPRGEADETPAAPERGNRPSSDRRGNRANDLPVASREKSDEDLLKQLQAALDEVDAASDDEQNGSENESEEEKTSRQAGPSDESEEAAPSSGRKSAKAADGESEVRIAVYGGNIVISSDNPEELDRLERFIQSLSTTTASKTKWSVYYLRVADATETATMLGHLFPQGSVSQTAESNSSMFGGITSSLSRMGSSLMDASGLSSLGSGSNALRIIPELRSNALFIAGPTEQVDQVLEALRFLDASELPESLKDRKPRMIPVEYADVNEVAEIVRDVYKEQMEAPLQIGGGGGRGGQGGGFNPLAMIMGGAMAQSSGNRQQRGIQMTIGVDDRTNTLVVSASDSLFKQVETLVAALDESALEARRTVKVVSLKNANSSTVQSALSGLLGKVKVSSTGTSSDRSRSTGSDGRPPFNGGPPFGGGNDQTRAFFQQRMMEGMMRGGGQGGNPFGGGNNPFGGAQGGGNNSGGQASFFGGRGGGGQNGGQGGGANFGGGGGRGGGRGRN